MVQTGPDDNHRAAVRLIGVIGKLTGGTNDVGPSNAGDFFSPRRSVRLNLIVAFGAVVIVQTALQAVVGHGQVINGGHQSGAPIRQLQAFYRQLMQQDVLQLNAGEVLGAFAAKVREAHLGDLILAAQQAQLQFGFVTGRAVALLEVPFAFFTPAEAD